MKRREVLQAFQNRVNHFSLACDYYRGTTDHSCYAVALSNLGTAKMDLQFISRGKNWRWHDQYPYSAVVRYYGQP